MARCHRTLTLFMGRLRCITASTAEQVKASCLKLPRFPSLPSRRAQFLLISTMEEPTMEETEISLLRLYPPPVPCHLLPETFTRAAAAVHLITCRSAAVVGTLEAVWEEVGAECWQWAEVPVCGLHRAPLLATSRTPCLTCCPAARTTTQASRSKRRLLLFISTGFSYFCRCQCCNSFQKKLLLLFLLSINNI